MNQAGVVIVTWNSGEVIERCVASCLGLPIVIVDNASITRPSVSGATLLFNSRNLGFAAAVNQGVRALDTEFVLLLNPDAVLNGSIETLVRAFDDPAVGAAGGQLLGEDGRPQTGFNVRRLPGPAALAFEALGLNRIFPWNPVNRAWRCAGFDPSRSAFVEQPAGAFLMIRRSAWQRVGGFDEQFYPVWFEDVDFCRRLKDAGFLIRYVPEVSATHQGGHSVKLLTDYSPLYWYGSLLKYASRHFRPWAVRCVGAAVILGSVLRAAGGMLARRSLAPGRTALRVVRTAAPCVLYGRITEPPGNRGFESRKVRTITSSTR